MTKIWHAVDSQVVVGPTIASVLDTGPIYDQIVAGSSEVQIEGLLKNITVVDPEGTVDKEDFLGTTDDFQNAELTYKPFGIGSVTGTLVVTDVQKLEYFFMGTTGTALSGTTSTGTRYQPGCFASTKERSEVAVGVRLQQTGSLNSTEKKVYLGLNNALITKLGDYKISGPDGIWEVDVEISCLPRDFYVEYMNGA